MPLWLGKRRRRERLMRSLLSPEERAIVERNVRYYRYLTDEQRRELDGFMRVFLAEKHFEGCGGLEVTEAMRLTIAAQACLLLLGRKSEFYPLLQSVLVYPSAYLGAERDLQADGTLPDLPEERIGESWARGSVVLSWDDVERGGAADGVNVAFHEFAHQLDEEDGVSDGTPKLAGARAYAQWSRVLGAAYDEHVAAVERGAVTLLDEYGAESPAEFFAVATECFFERGPELKARHPDLYGELQGVYRLDPAAVLPPPPVVRRRVRRHPRPGR